MFSRKQLVRIYLAIITVAFVVSVSSGFSISKKAVENFDEINVHRINILEPDGTLRMVISNHAQLPGIIVRGKEQPLARPQAGMLFYNEEGSESGGLIFGGHRNSNGEVVDSGGSLSFDKYEANQIVQLAGVDDKEDRFAGLIIGDSVTGTDNRRRIWVGRSEDGTATVTLMDANGKKRIEMEVKPNGTPRLLFLAEDGQIISELPARAKRRVRH